MAKSLLSDVSISEMQNMREMGMTNTEIAESLDVSIGTVYNYLGKQPKGLRHERRLDAAGGAMVKKTEKEEPIIPACLAVMARRYELNGEVAGYDVDMVNGDIVLKLNRDGAEYGTLTLKADELEGLIKELSAINRKMQAGNQLEVW